MHHVLTRQELLRRRSRRLRRLARHYTRHYWCLVGHLGAKLREYQLSFGISPVELQPAELAEGSGENSLERGFCGVEGCKGRAMPLSGFCYEHILCDGRQMLYKPCAFRIISGKTGPIICGKPVLKAAMPSLCTMHLQMTEKHISQALKKAGLTIASSRKPAPGLHVIIAEYIKHIQLNRKEILNAIKKENATEDDNAG